MLSLGSSGSFPSCNARVENELEQGAEERRLKLHRKFSYVQNELPFFDRPPKKRLSSYRLKKYILSAKKKIVGLPTK